MGQPIVSLASAESVSWSADTHLRGWQLGAALLRHSWRLTSPEKEGIANEHSIGSPGHTIQRDR